jgi:hypothetical protein
MDKVFIAGILLTLIPGFPVIGYAQERDASTLLEHFQTPKAPVFLQLSDQPHMIGTTDMPEQGQEDEKPPLDGVKIAGEALTGCFTGCGGFLMSLVAIFALEETSVYPPFWLASGTSFGSAVGVYAVGNIGNETGSFKATLAGSCLGAALSLATLYSDTPEDFVVALPCCSLAGAIIGFNLTRRHKSPPVESQNALINFRNSQMSLAVPNVYFRPDSSGRGNLTQRVDLVRISF